MIVYAGNLHAQVVQSLLGSWGYDNHQISFKLEGPVGKETMTMEFDGRTVRGCMIEFNKIGELTIVSEQGERFPMEAIINLDNGYELRLWLNNQEQRFIRNAA